MVEENIILVDYGIANNFGDFIEINKNLKKYPHLYNSILNHELKHKPGGFTWFDLKHDLKGNEFNKDLFKFMFKYPKSFTQFLPIYWTRKKGFVYDTNLILVYIFFISILTFSFFISWKLF